jgi:hypothetical protein
MNLKEMIGVDISIPDEVWWRQVVRIPQSKLRQSMKKADDAMDIDTHDAPFYSLARATAEEPFSVRREFDPITSSTQVIGLLKTYYEGKMEESARSKQHEASTDPMMEDEFKPFPVPKGASATQKLRINPQKLLRRRKDPVQTTGAAGSFQRIVQRTKKKGIVY